MSTPYMLNLHPVTILSSISDTIQSGDNKLEDVDSVAGYVADGMEHIFNSGIQLRYGRDLRLNEFGERSLCNHHALDSPGAQELMTDLTS
ncbi:hypothetical protein T459_21795 [Capsicum annuum]|uniref:Uncharacterized protein n=1 Tax=Capsicum annuum TaxID=4072 RepID=A0A2G2YXM9_CAPAN|nr:hypothetical protein T459_21795 [Capsicum annuum]